jgi:hypothetical protein
LDPFDQILNKKRAGFPLVSAFDKVSGKNPTEKQKLINAVLADSFKPFHKEQSIDIYIHYGALEELKTNKQRIYVYLL